VPRWVFRWLVNALALLAAAALLRGVRVDTALAGFVAAGLLGVVNVSIRPVLILATLPINVLTLGLFTFVINALMLMLVAWLVPGFDIDGFWWSVAAALVLSVVNTVVTWLTPRHWTGRYYY
jgi:Predicted membrane protein